MTTPASRTLLRCYEIFVVGLLLALVVLAAWPDARAQEGAASPQCGKNQSSPEVMNR